MRIIGSVLCKVRRAFEMVRLGKRVRIGQGVVFRKGFFLNPSRKTSRITIGDGCFFNNNCSINCHSCISIGCKSTFGEGVKLYDHDHNFRKIRDGRSVPSLFVDAPINIGDDCWFGSNVIILKGVTIGNNVVVGAGTIITKDIPDNTIVYARQDLVFRTIEPEE